MNGLEILDNMKANDSLHTRILGVVLRSHLPELSSPLSKILCCTFDHEFATSTNKNNDGWVRLPSFTLTKKLITAANTLVFFGPDLAANSSFLEAALAYPEDTFFAAKVLRLLPSVIHPILAPALMRNHRATKAMVSHLTPVVEHRLRRARERQSADAGVIRPLDCIQFFVDASTNNRQDDWPSQKIVQGLLGTWLAAVHQPALTAVYLLEDLCEHVEYVEHIRQELALHLGFRLTSDVGDEHCDAFSTAAAAAIEDAPLLDAFLKESSRLHPSDSISVRRKVLKPFTFRDGTHILPGDVACVPSQAIMRDEIVYAQSTVFSPWRFITYGETCMGSSEQRLSTKRGSRSRFSDAEPTYPLWGLGRHSW
ncbi:hypothetical protein CDD83_7267 [Cordyceps sp. RAO-2017]|nr:hypothetical protein CDD83_7267 [Cordyceps sp. RAO-2017]